MSLIPLVSTRVRWCVGIWLLLTGAVLPHPTIAQALPPKAHALPLLVFLDCGACDGDYLRTAIPWVDYVHDRADAHVHVLETSLPTGAGGTAYTLAFFGRGVFLGVNDTLQWVAAPTATGDEIRHGLAHLVQLGLVRYVAASPVGQALTVEYHPDADTLHRGSLPQPPDAWRGWFFTTGVSGYVSGQQSQTSGALSSSAAADRTTEGLKVDAGLSESDHWSSYVLPGAGTFRTATRSYDVSGQLLHSVSEHWSVGEHAEVGNSSYHNERVWVRLAPAVEYDLFPYAQATNHQLALQSSVGVVHLRFIDTTLDNRIALTAGDWRTSVAYVATQPWGSASVSLTSAALLTAVRRQNVSVSASWNLRLAKGFSLSPSGGLSWIRNQPYLSGKGLTPDEILVQQQMLATSYTYNLSLGLSYAFGSSFNNIVNPRFNTGTVLTVGPGSL